MRSCVESEAFTVLGIRIDNVRIEEAVNDVVSLAEDDDAPPRQLCFVNAHCINVACVDSAYASIVQAAPRVFADGIGVRLAARAQGVDVVDNVNGTDLFPPLCAAFEERGLPVYLLGARPGVVEGVVSWLRAQYPRLTIAGSHHGHFSPEDEPEIIEAVRASGARVLLVAMGVPRQEKWIEANLDRLGVKVAVGVGALFDFYSNTVPRAPVWMRKRGLEWVYRLYQEPGRMWRRYVVGNPQFMWRVARQTVLLPRLSRLSRLFRVGLTRTR